MAWPRSIFHRFFSLRFFFFLFSLHRRLLLLFLFRSDRTTATRYKLRHTHLRAVFSLNRAYTEDDDAPLLRNPNQGDPSLFSQHSVNATVIILNTSIGRRVSNFHRFDVRKEFEGSEKRREKSFASRSWVVINQSTSEKVALLLSTRFCWRPVVENYIARASISHRCARGRISERMLRIPRKRAFQFF